MVKQYRVWMLGLMCFAKVEGSGSEEKEIKMQKILPEKEVYSRNRRLSEQAMEKVEHIMGRIKEHPFILELVKGTLSYEKFSCYVENDCEFLRKMGQAMAVLAKKLPQELQKNFLAITAEFDFEAAKNLSSEKVFHSYVNDSKAQFVKESNETPALHAYTNYFSSLVYSESYEIAAASFLPCPWVYYDLACHLKKDADPKEAFYPWIAQYSTPEYGEAVEKARDIFDALADKASDEIRTKMVEAFINGVVYEWHFWNDAYQMKPFLPE